MTQAALVTGSGRGIGRAIALALAEQGFAIALNGPEMDSDLQSTADALCAYNVPVTTEVFDITDVAGHEAHLAAIEAAIGPLTTLVNNAGVGALQRGDPLEVSEASFDRCLAVNTKGGFFLSQAFARRLLARDRPADRTYAIINITSSNATAVAVTRAEYCVSKAAAAMASKAFAARLGGDNIQVYDVQPGIIETALTAPVMDDYRARIADGLTLMPRSGQPADIGRIVATLATGQLPYTTGQVISADGGLLVPRF